MIKLKRPRRLAAKMLLSSAACNLQFFKEYLIALRFFDESNPKSHKDVREALDKIQAQIRDMRHIFGNEAAEKES